MSTSDKPESEQPPVEKTAEDTQERLDDLIARAAAKDAVKDFNAAAELYSEATELQANLKGEMSPGNADLLYSYGKALYNVAVSKSDVLGSRVAGETPAQPGSKSEENTTSSKSASSPNLVQNAIASGAAKNASLGEATTAKKAENTAFFQFTGDENYDDSDSEEEGEKDGGAEDDDDDDFANAFEVLDLARILYHKQLTMAEEESGKGKSTELPPNVKHIKERLADTYDLQAEISLEAERFSDAVSDLRTTLELRQSLFPMEDPSVAECHYKLSLALEFDSAHKEDADTGKTGGQEKFNEEMRAEAAVQMEKAIESCRARMAQEEKQLADESLDEDKATAIKRKIANVKEIVADMEQRLIDLRRPPVSIEESNDKNEAFLKGILGQMMGETPAQQAARLDAATKNANDLSGLVKKRKQPSSQPSEGASSGQKRSAAENGEDATKRARTDDSA
ncbi:conserved hypothetical protein [Aspergillus terreus NIH2624]|uniref:Tetratricopeptide SHNi-TPR domain-containing protein n=1 Tax=Aspergillus terreus (strain NIH 2624 / FGSC A1156) TaxID=341663 RepID=Q0CL21_ASPTN|nr:uncharacterized protein ATEG_05613 [Aspergillus terreus NIH2624]EAU34682.1 conserved hypothetical protein [Aspergillus terreus NIH2624]